MSLRVATTPLEPQTEVGFAAVSDLDVVADGTLVVLTRDPAAVVRYDASGAYLGHWGRGVFVHPHGITVDGDTLYVVDQYGHDVRRFTLDGRELARIGSGPSDTGFDWKRPSYEERYLTVARGGAPFNNPTKAVVAPDGSLFVSDGYGNARVHRFDAQHRLVGSWGEPGSGRGEFRLPHGVCVTETRVLVADRENDRIECFDHDGGFVGSWTDVQRPAAVVALGGDRFLVGELSRSRGQRSFVHGVPTDDRPARLSVLDGEGRMHARCVLDTAAVGHELPVQPHGLSRRHADRVWVANLAGGHRSPLVSVGYDELPCAHGI